MTSDAALAQYHEAMQRYYAVIDGEADGDELTLLKRAESCRVGYDRPLMQEFDATVTATPLGCYAAN